MHQEYDAAIIGGGFFGCAIALRIRQHFPRVALIERESNLLSRASYANQARIHNGYHYPRCLQTALSSRVNYSRFLCDYADCIERGFRKYYAIGRQFSKVSAQYFATFCRRIGARLEPAPSEVRRLFNPATIEEVFEVDECAFDANRLRQRLARELEKAAVDVGLDTSIQSITSVGPATLQIDGASPNGNVTIQSRHVFNCTYSEINRLLAGTGETVPLKHELAEIALVDVPAALHGLGVTVMCGPFFSCMPFPPRGLHSLSHVRYTPHQSWQEGSNQSRSMLSGRPTGTTNFPLMVRDACRYLPALADCVYRDSLWEVKTVLPASESNDSRPILFQKNIGLHGLHCVMGAKLDNIYDVLEEVTEFLTQARSAA